MCLSATSYAPLYKESQTQYSPLDVVARDISLKVVKVLNPVDNPIDFT